MSHGCMTLAQAKELQRRYGGGVLKVGLPDNPKYCHYPATDVGLMSEVAISCRQMEYQLDVHRVKQNVKE